MKYPNLTKVVRGAVHAVEPTSNFTVYNDLMSDGSRRLKFDLSVTGHSGRKDLAEAVQDILEWCEFDSQCSYTVRLVPAKDDRAYSCYPHLEVRYLAHNEQRLRKDVDDPILVDDQVIGFYRELDGNKFWLDHNEGRWTGTYHRVDGPAVIWADGRLEWWLHGKRHCNTGPAVVYPNGALEFWLDGNPVVPESLPQLG